LAGDRQNNVIKGGEGDDKIYGNGGNDTIHGEGGLNTYFLKELSEFGGFEMKCS
jgi:Ca2+-binding RTX toxin-like protein